MAITFNRLPDVSHLNPVPGLRANMFTAESEGYSSYIHRRPIWPRIKIPLAGAVAFITLAFAVVGCLH